MTVAKRNPYQDQAESLALTRYGPEVSALKALLLQAQEDRDTALRQATSTRQFSVGAVDAAGPQIQRAYRTAGQAVSPAFAQGGGVEAQALQARMGESQALAQQQLAARRVSAIEGEGAAQSAAQRNFRSDRSKISARAEDLARESGAFTASTITDLLGADAKATADAQQQQATLTQQERNSIRSAGQDPDAPLEGGGYAPIPGGPLDPKAKRGKPNAGRGWATQEAQAAAGDEIGRLIREAQENKASGESRADTADLLHTGLPAGKVPRYETFDTGKKDDKGKPVMGRRKKLVKDANGNLVEDVIDDPGITAAKSQLLLQAALDMAYDGHLSRRTQKLLHDRQIQLGPLGLVTFGDWLKTPEGQAWKAAQGANRTPQRARPKNTRSIRDIYG